MKEKWAALQKKRWFKILSNKFTLATIAFLIWMGFLDLNSWRLHWQLNEEIDKLENSIEYYNREIAKDSQRLEELTTDPEMLEKYAREQYLLQRPGEEIFIIEREDGTAQQ